MKSSWDSNRKKVCSVSFFLLQADWTNQAISKNREKS